MKCQSCGTDELIPTSTIGNRQYYCCRNCNAESSATLVSHAEAWAKEGLRKLAQEALDVQNAVNLSGVVHGFSRAITQLRALCPKLGTDDINKHPICVLWADKIAHLTGTQSFSGPAVVSEAYNTVAHLAEVK